MINIKQVGGKRRKKGGMKHLKDEEIQELINESYEKSMVMLDSFHDNNNNNNVNKLKALLNLYFNLHHSIENPDRKLLIHSLEVLHLVGTNYK